MSVRVPTNLFELAAALPNGLHDSRLLRLALDYEEHLAVLDLEIWVGDMDGPADQKESYRAARITLNDFAYFSIDPPDSSYPFREAGAVTIDLAKPASVLVAGTDQALAFRLFVSEWNAFIHASSSDVRLEWRGEQFVR